MPNLSRENHYLPRFYSRQWADEQGYVCAYRTLVPTSTYPEWRREPHGKIGVRRDLYTSVKSGEESDRIERWLNEEFEQPAVRVLARLRDDQRLSREEIAILVRFAASLDQRNPERFAGHERFLAEHGQEMIRSVQQRVMRRYAHLRRTGRLPPATSTEDWSPFRTRAVRVDGMPMLETEMTTGRELWLQSIELALTSTIRVLLAQDWTVLQPPRGWSWLTSDNPFVRLAVTAEGYHLEGGWGRHRTDLFMPLTPKHLLICNVGSPAPSWTRCPIDLAGTLQRMTVENAHRWILALEPNRKAAWFRPRQVDLATFRDEEQAWGRLHEVQRRAVREE